MADRAGVALRTLTAIRENRIAALRAGLEYVLEADDWADARRIVREALRVDDVEAATAVDRAVAAAGD